MASTANNVVGKEDPGCTNSADAAASSSKPSSLSYQTIVQYVFLRRDLEWPAGAMAAQAAHVSVAAVTQALRAHHEPTQQYVHPERVDHMTKCVYGVDTLEELDRIRCAWNDLIRKQQEQSSQSTVDSAGVDDNKNPPEALQSYWWVEQPENIPSAFATWPVVRTNQVSKVIKKLKLNYF